MKSTFTKKAFALASVMVMLLFNTAFVPKEKVNMLQSGYYFFEAAQRGHSTDIYLTTALHYEGSNYLSNELIFSRAAYDAFRTYLTAEFPDMTFYSSNQFMLGYSNKFKTKEQAQDALDDYVINKKSRGEKVILTNFSFSYEKYSRK